MTSLQNSIATPDHKPYAIAIQTAPIKPAHKRSKLEYQLDNIVFFLTNFQENGNQIILCKNLMSTKYVIWSFQIYFWGEDRLVNRIKSDVYFQTGGIITDTIIKSALQIISGKQELWIYDSKNNRTTPIRSMSLYRRHFTYFFNGIYHVNNNFNNVGIIGTYTSKGMEIIQVPRNPNFLNELDCTRNNDIVESLYFIKILVKKLKIPEDYFLIILTWLIQSIASDNYTLLELIGESKTGKTYIQSVLKNLIDPNLELTTQAPKKLKDLEKQTMDGHLMSIDDVKNLSDDMQQFMVSLMSFNGVKIACPTDNKEYSGDIFVRRPIILNSVMPVVTHEKLQSKTLTIELKTPEIKWHEDHEVDINLIDFARLELLKLAKAIFSFNTNKILPRCVYKDLYEFSEIGLRLSHILYMTTDTFEKQMNILIKEQSLAKLQENQTGYLAFLWAQENTNTKKEMSVANWIEKFEIYHDVRFGEWKITPKQFGSDLKKVAPTLREFGIHCESLGKRGSFVKWKIITAAKIEI